MSDRYQNAEACGIEPEREGDEPTPEQWRKRCQHLWAENARLRGNGAELAAAAERLLGTSVTERNEPSVWFPRVDALKLAIAVMRGRIVHGSASSSTKET